MNRINFGLRQKFHPLLQISESYRPVDTLLRYLPAVSPAPVFVKLLLLWLWFCTPLQAHMMPVLSGTIKLIDNRCYAVVEIPVSAFPQLAAIETSAERAVRFTAQVDAIRRTIPERFQVSSDSETLRITQLFASFSPADSSLPNDKDAVTLMIEGQFDTAPKTLRVSSDLFGQTDSESQLTLTLQRDGMIEAGILTVMQPSFVFLETAERMFLRFVKTGMEHILTGNDHLLFLLTLLVSGTGWRHWLVLLSSFTVAHSITFCMAALGALHYSAVLVEAAIAASIVITAAINLFFRPLPLLLMALIVFLCGLLHGLGFSSSLGATGLSENHLVISLLGFNGGIELGQLVFVFLSYCALSSAMHCFKGPAAQRAIRGLPSVTGLLIGSYWLIERLQQAFDAVNDSAAFWRAIMSL